MDYLAEGALQNWADENGITSYEAVNQIAQKFLPLFEAAVYKNLASIRERNGRDS